MDEFCTAAMACAASVWIRISRRQRSLWNGESQRSHDKQRTFFYFNHLILFLIWAAFHCAFLNHREPLKTLFPKLYLAIVINFIFNFILFLVFDEFFAVNSLRTLTTIMFMLLVVKFVVKDSWMNTVFAMIFHTVCILFSEMLAILVMVAASGFDQAAFQDASFFSMAGFLVMDF